MGLRDASASKKDMSHDVQLWNYICSQNIRTSRSNTNMAGLFADYIFSLDFRGEMFLNVVDKNVN